MRYNNDNLIVASKIVQLENELDDLVNDVTSFKQQLKTKFDGFDVDLSEDMTLKEAINNLKQLKNASDVRYGNIFNGVPYDLEKEPINKNEIKFVALIKSGQKIGFDLGLVSYRKPVDAFLKANQFITVDWGDGTSSMGYNKFVHIYDDVKNNTLFKPFNDEYKQVVITVKPTSYEEEESTLMPVSIAFHSVCTNLILGINVNYLGKNTDYYNHENKQISSYQNHYNLRYYYTTEAYLQPSNNFYNCTRLEKIKAKKLYMTDNTENAFMNNWSLKEIDADLIVDREYNNTRRISMFENCYNLVKIKSLNFGTVTTSAIHSSIFSNCFKLEKIPQLSIDCSKDASTTGRLFHECRSLINPFQYLTNTDMLKIATYLFKGCHKIITAPNELNLSLATNTNGLFEGCINMETAPKKLFLDKSTDIRYLFADCWNLKNTPTIITTKSATNCTHMFYKCYNLEVISCDLDLSNTGYDYSNIFTYCYSLREFDCARVLLGKKYSSELQSLFSHSTNLKKLPTQEFSCSMFYGRNWPCDIEEFSDTMTFYLQQHYDYEFRTLAEIKKMPKIVNIKRGDHTTGRLRLFENCRTVTSINDLIVNIDNDLTPEINYCFSGCWSLEQINNLTINAPNNTQIVGFFQNCYRLSELNNLHINLKENSNINISNIFQNCYSLNRIPNLGFSYEECVNSMAYAFEYTGIQEVVWENTLTRLANIAFAFRGCKSLEKVNIKVSTATDFNYWISTCYSLKSFDCIFEMPSNNNPFNNSGFPTVTISDIKIDFKNKPWGSNGTFNCTYSTRLSSFEIYNYANTNMININDNYRLRKVIITFKSGTSCNINMRNGRIPGTALNKFFESLPTVTSGNRTIYVKGQTHIAESDIDIAQRKGWTINTTG